MKFVARMLVFVLAIAAGGLQARAQSLGSVVGTWRLVSFDREVLETKTVSHAFGGHAVGLLTYTADGRMMAIVVDSTRKPPARPTASDAEALRLYRTTLAYAGTYTIQGNAIIHHVEISWNQTLTGTDQKRFFKLAGDRLTLTTPPFVTGLLGNQATVSTLVWRRAKRLQGNRVGCIGYQALPDSSQNGGC